MILSCKSYFISLKDIALNMVSDTYYVPEKFADFVKYVKSIFDFRLNKCLCSSMLSGILVNNHMNQLSNSYLVLSLSYRLEPTNDF